MRVKCYRCGEIGRLENHSGNKYRINHDYMKKGKKYRRRHYLGDLKVKLAKIQSVSKIRDDLIPSEIYNEIVEHYRKSKHDDRLVNAILQLASKFRPGWSNEEHKLLKQSRCPHCRKLIAVRYKRLGKNPKYSGGKYNIAEFGIEKGLKDRTSTFYQSFGGGLRNEWELGVEKGDSKKSDTFFED